MANITTLTKRSTEFLFQSLVIFVCVTCLSGCLNSSNVYEEEVKLNCTAEERSKGSSCSECIDGEVRRCNNDCGNSGVEYCNEGIFLGCTAAQCADQDLPTSDCDQESIEDCELCVDGIAQECETACGTGIRLCEDGQYGECSAPFPVAESCEGVSDEDCDGLIDEGCDCIMSIEILDSLDNDCDGLIDEDLNCELTELCDGIDNDCDGEIDENIDPPLPNHNAGVCIGLTKICVGSIGWIEPDYSQVPTYEIREQSCDGLDNDCDGSTDEDLSPLPADSQQGVCLGLTKVCSGEGGWVEPDYTDLIQDELLDGIDNDCDGLVDEMISISDEVCDGIDNDADGTVDESVCGRLIYEHCELSLAWWQNRENEDPIMAPWLYWPPDQAEENACPNVETDELYFGCDRARANTGFQSINIQALQFGQDSWLGLDWQCNPNMLNLPEERDIISWAQESCHVALAYQDAAESEFNLDPQSCPYDSRADTYNTQRCIQTSESMGYSAIELEGIVNFDDKFGWAFYCEDNSPLSDTEPSHFSTLVQNELRIFLGVNFSDDAIEDGVESWGQLPNITTDTIGSVIGVGTLTDGQFNELSLNRRIRSHAQVGVMLYLRP